MVHLGKIPSSPSLGVHGTHHPPNPYGAHIVCQVQGWPLRTHEAHDQSGGDQPDPLDHTAQQAPTVALGRCKHSAHLLCSPRHSLDTDLAMQLKAGVRGMAKGGSAQVLVRKDS